MAAESERQSGIYMSQMNRSIIVGIFDKICLFDKFKRLKDHFNSFRYLTKRPALATANWMAIKC